MTDAEHMSYLRRATKAADRALHGVPVAGQTAWDFAVEAWIYNHERGISQEFCSRRAYFLAVDALRRELGRTDARKLKKPLARVYPNSKLIHRGVVRPKEIFDLPDMSGWGRFGQICQGLMDGRTKEEVAIWMGISKSRVSQILSEHLPLLARHVPRGSGEWVFHMAVGPAERERITRLLKAVWDAG